MIVVLTAGLVVVAAVAVLNLALAMAIVKRLRGIEQRLSTFGDGSDSLPAVGSAIEGFRLTLTDGETVGDAELAKGRRQIIVLSPTCEPCRDLAGQLIDDPEAAEPGALVLVTGSPAEAREMADTLPAGLRIGLDSEDTHLSALSVGAYPAVLTIVDGVVADAAHLLPKRARALSAA